MRLGRHAQLTLLHAGRTIEERFCAFDDANPSVWKAFERHALALINAGRRHYSADGILHVIRFHVALATHNTDGDGFKLNNDYSSRYARKFATAHPEHAEFFEQRRLAS